MQKNIAKINESGRILIPFEIRRLLGFEIGEDVVLEISENQLKISSLKTLIRNAQSKIANFTKGGIALTNSLKEMRNEERE